jgi:hypothetical protein
LSVAVENDEAIAVVVYRPRGRKMALLRDHGVWPLWGPRHLGALYPTVYTEVQFVCSFGQWSARARLA